MQHANKSVQVKQFAMNPKRDIPRSSFKMQKRRLTTFNAGQLIPIYVKDILPGDTFNLNMHFICRMSTPLFPIMDNLYLETQFFFVPNRLVWDHWVNMMGEKATPTDETEYTVPQITSDDPGYNALSLYDYMGLPIEELAGTFEHSALPMRAYNLIFNEWYRDQNLQDPRPFTKDDGPDDYADYLLANRGKRHDYFTSCLPWPQKGDPVSLPLGTTAPVVPIDASPTFKYGAGTGTSLGNWRVSGDGPDDGFMAVSISPAADQDVRWNNPQLEVNLALATAATINQLRYAEAIQTVLERDARGGTRYTEFVYTHFGVRSPDARLQRPEYLGGGSTIININPIAQTSETTVTSPQGSLAAIGTASGCHGFTQSFTEHGYIIGLANVRADLTYQQGLPRHFSKKTKWDFYLPALAALGEQEVLNKEIFCDGSAADEVTWGYQERWAEYRYDPSDVTGAFRSKYSAPLDGWHLAQYFETRPEFNGGFIVDNPPMDRVLAVGAAAQGQQFIMDTLFDVRAARPLPLYSIPGLTNRF